MAEQVILLVEDNPDDEALTLRALKKHHLANRVVVARDGAEALDYLFGTGVHAGRDAGDTPTFILQDLKLPKVDGLEVLRRLRADNRTTGIPVAALTSSAEEKDIVESHRSHVNSYIRKPVDFVHFVDMVQQIGLYWMVINQPLPQAA
ncbi:MAG: response regulator [Dehalococcoidia bacterium]|nr:response regulator [Dehalococcoidia bacterium]MSQ15990.1 response regulator [Dehalococcoidia bacterium]